MPKMVKKRKTASSEQNGVMISFDIGMLDALIKYSRCEHVSQSNKTLLLKLLKHLDFSQYEYSPDILDRLKLLKVTCTAMCEESIRDESVLRAYIAEHLEDSEEIMKQVSFELNLLTDTECKRLTTAINERLQYIYIYEEKDYLVNAFNDMSRVGFTSYHDTVNSLKERMANLVVKLNNVSAPDQLIRSFSFSDESYFELLSSIVHRAKKPSTVLMTGIRQLNAILSPGFQSGRLYTILGGTGRFKSGTLWNITDQIRLFNPHIKPYENGKRKTILFITMENTIYETIIRLFDMYNPTGKDIKDMEPEEVAEILRTEGHFMFNSEHGIDIEMRYYSDLEIATSHIYTLIQELSDNGKQVIAVVLDYILKINSAKEHYGDERLRLSFAGRELKALAQYFDIPVITAMQINREGNGILDAAMQENKEDVGRFIGTSFVGTCWDLIQESDWVCFINLEMQRSTGKWFLSFKRLKIRGKKDPLASDYFNHPFVNNNGIRLEPDVNKPEPLSVVSLASDLVSVDDTVKVPDNNARKRPTVTSVAASSSNTKNVPSFKEVPIAGLIKAAG